MVPVHREENAPAVWFTAGRVRKKEPDMKTRTFAAIAAAAAIAPAALAYDAYTDLSAWEAAAGTATHDDLSSYGTISLAPGANDFDGYTVTLAGASTGSAAINSATNFTFTLNTGLDSITYTFDSAVSGFGAVWLNSFVSNGITMSIDGGESFNLEDYYAAANFDFLGFAGGSFTTVTITATDPLGGSEFAAISDVYYTPVPAPASAALLGLGGLAMTRRRR